MPQKRQATVTYFFLFVYFVVDWLLLIKQNLIYYHDGKSLLRTMYETDVM